LIKKKKTLTISDKGVESTAEEVDKYTTRSHSVAQKNFRKNIKGRMKPIIGHFGLDFTLLLW